MLKKEYRLNAKERLIFTNSINSPFFTLKTVKSNRVHNRYGFVISKKIDKRAVARNRIKRVFRTYIEGSLKDIKPGFDMLFIIKKSILSIPERDYGPSIKNVLEKGQLLK